MIYHSEKDKSTEKTQACEGTVNYRLLKLRSKILANNSNISINNLHIFSMDSFGTAS